MVTLPDGTTRAWKRIVAQKDGPFRDPALSGGYAYVPVEAGVPQVRILEASAHAMVYVNGEPRAGDIYGYGWTRLPVLLRPGTNDLLFGGGRGGELHVRLASPRAPA